MGHSDKPRLRCLRCRVTWAGHTPPEGPTWVVSESTVILDLRHLPCHVLQGLIFSHRRCNKKDVIGGPAVKYHFVIQCGFTFRIVH